MKFGYISHEIAKLLKKILETETFYAHLSQHGNVFYFWKHFFNEITIIVWEFYHLW